MPPPRLKHAREPQISLPKPAETKDVGTGTQPSLGMFAALGGYPASTGVPVTPFTAMQSSAVYGCVNRLGQDIAKLPMGLRTRLPDNAGYETVSRHPILRLMQRPNWWMTPFQFFRYMVSCLKLRGNAYAAIVRDAGGQPIELIPIGPDRISVYVSPRGVVFYNFSHPLIGEGVVWHSENILHFREMTVDGGYIGISPISYAQDVMGVSIAAQRQAAILFRQGNQTGGVLSTDKPLSPETVAQIKNELLLQHAGVENSSKPMVLGGGFKYDRMSMTPDEAQFLESRKFSVEEICRIFGVPPHKIAHIVGGTFANLENQEQAYINDALQPLATEIEQEMARKLFFSDEMDDGLELFFDFKALLRGDMKTRFDALSVAIQTGIMNINEARSGEGYGPVPGGEVYRFPLNTGEVGAATPPPTGAPGDQAPTPADVTPPAIEE